MSATRVFGHDQANRTGRTIDVLLPGLSAVGFRPHPKPTVMGQFRRPRQPLLLNAHFAVCRRAHSAPALRFPPQRANAARWGPQGSTFLPPALLTALTVAPAAERARRRGSARRQRDTCGGGCSAHSAGISERHPERHGHTGVRRWRRPTVRAGGTLLTAIGQLQIVSVEPISTISLKPTRAERLRFARHSARGARTTTGWSVVSHPVW